MPPTSPSSSGPEPAPVRPFSQRVIDVLADGVMDLLNQYSAGVALHADSSFL
jgi:hypothetical protein